LQSRAQAISSQDGAQSIVLLSNKDHFLPLDKSKLKMIASSVRTRISSPPAVTGPGDRPGDALQGIKNRAAQGTEVLFARAPRSHAEKAPKCRSKRRELRKAARLRRRPMWLSCMSDDIECRAEGRDRNSLICPQSGDWSGGA